MYNKLNILYITEKNKIIPQLSKCQNICQYVHFAPITIHYKEHIHIYQHWISTFQNYNFKKFPHLTLVPLTLFDVIP